jgi:hypothetical protein
MTQPTSTDAVSKERRNERLGRIQLRCEQSSRPAGTTVSEFDDLQERVFALYAERRFEEIHRLLDGAVERFPNRPSRITFWQACIDSLLGDPKRALERLRRGAEEGLFWPENWLDTDPDLAAARALPGYEEMVEAVGRSAERANSNRRERPEVLLFAREAGPVRGLLIGLHMYERSAAESAAYWRPATEIGLVVVVPESTQVSGDGEPAWTDPAVTARDIRLAREEALDRLPGGRGSDGPRWGLTGRRAGGSDCTDRRPVSLSWAGGGRLRLP